MAFKPLADLDASTTTAIGGVNKETGKKNPTSIEGYFVGTRQVPSRKAKSGFCSLHILQTAQGNVGVWGKTNLDQKIPSVLPGQMIRISFVGMVETPNNPMYKYKVEVDADNTIEVNLTDDTAAGATAAGALEAGAYEDAPDETDPTTEDDQPYEAPTALPARRPAAPAQPASSERQAAVRNVLGKR